MSDSVAITVNTLIPDDLLRSFEGFLLERMMSKRSESGLTFLYSEDGTSDEIEFLDKAELAMIIGMADQSGSLPAQQLLPFLRQLLEIPRIHAGYSIKFSDLHRHDVTVDYVDLIAAIVDRHPDALPHVQIQYACMGRMKPGEIGGGAIFITPGSVKTMDSHLWLHERCRELQEEPEADGPKP